MSIHGAPHREPGKRVSLTGYSGSTARKQAAEPEYALAVSVERHWESGLEEELARCRRSLAKTLELIPDNFPS